MLLIGRGGLYYFPFIAFGLLRLQSMRLMPFIPNGSKIAIEGRWTTGDYTDKDGNKHYTNACTVERMEFVESKKNADAPANVPPATEPRYVPEGFSELDDIPF